MLRLDCSVPSASSVEVGEAQVVLRRPAEAWRGRSGLWAHKTRVSGNKRSSRGSRTSRTQLMLVIILLFYFTLLW